MDIRKLQRAVVDGLEDVKAQNIVVFNTEHLSSLFERVIIASGTSNRQTKSLASSVREAVKKAGYPVPRMEGETNGEWIIVDCGAAVVHVMQPSIRDYYHLEEIWGGKPVKMKIDATLPGLVKASEPDAAPAVKRGGRAGAPKPAARKTVAAKAPLKRAAAKKVAPATGRARAPAIAPALASAPAPARKAPAKRAVAPTSMVTRVVGVKKPAAKKGAAAKVVARPMMVRKAAAPKAVAKKALARKPAPRA
jgi:ribosome-associated protein